MISNKVKLLSILLGPIVLLSACGRDTTYDVLTQALTENDYATAKQELEKFSKDYEDEQILLDKYGELVNHLEQEDYSYVIQYVDEQIAQKNAEEIAQYEAVEINIDNWSDYFEIKHEEDWVLNGFGELESINISEILCFKPEIATVVGNLDNTAIDVGMSSLEYVYFNVEIDTDKKEYRLLDGDEIHPFEYHETESYSGTEIMEGADLFFAYAIGASNIIEKWADGRGGYYGQIYKDVTVERIQGTIYIKNE